MFSMSATTKAMQVGYKYNINLFMQNVLVYTYKLDESISNLGAAGWHFVFQILIEHFFSSCEDDSGVYG